ncbi:MAG: molybdenum cofactor guanylyltransferase [Planctomycetota bacterium]
MPEAIVPRSGWTGLLLAGGRSARMGTEKGRLPHDPRSGIDLFSKMVQRLQACCSQTLVLGGDRGFEQDGLMQDPIPDAEAHAGPLQALLHSATSWPTSWTLVLPLDMPALDASLLHNGQQAAEQALEEGHPAMFALDPQERGCFPLWLHQDALQPLKEFRSRGQRSLFAGLKHVGALGWRPSATRKVPGGDPFRNLNTPADLQAWHDCLPSQDA